MKSAAIKSTVLLSLMVWGAAAFSEVPSKASNVGGITNTRHNLTQSYLGGNAGFMSLSRNDYGEVCVYCHTPHGANSNVALPLWNRTIKSTTYATYDTLGTSTLTQTVNQPGRNSLSCLSCHDGTVAIDSIINMPGSGKYQASQATSQSDSFLNAWAGGPGGSFYGGHGTLQVSDSAFNEYGQCQSCHSISGPQFNPSGTPAFDAFYIGTDLTNDHPVGIHFPAAGPGVDFNQPNRSTGSISFFDTDGNGRADPKNVRLYDSGNGFSVECASCHDPHGVPSGGAGSVNNPTFMRVANTGSALCLTCHVK